MIAVDLETTNLLLGILAAVSVLEALVLIVGGVMAYRAYSAAMRTVHELEMRHVAPLAGRVDALMTKVDGVLVEVDGILVDVKEFTGRMGDRTRGQTRVGALVTVMNGARQVLGGFFNGRRSSGGAPEHAAEAGTGSIT
jgi:hypothetical protein